MPNKESGFPMPFHSVISSDSQYSVTDFCNDHTWEIVPNIQYPLGFCCQTTYGLRARSVQIIPVILDANNAPFRDPPPGLVLDTHLPNLVKYQVNLFNDINVVITLTVPDSHTLAGQFSILSKSNREKRLRAGVLMRLVPIPPGEQTTVQEENGRLILAGKTENLHPVCVVAGMPKQVNRPQPGLAVETSIQPDSLIHIRWAVSAKDSRKLSLEAASAACESLRLPGFVRQIKSFENDNIYIETGDAEWNEAFHLATIHSQRLVHSPTDVLPFAHPVDSRNPDNGYSMRGDGSDFDPELQGLSAFEVYHAIRNFYLPAKPNLALGIFANFIQKQQGFGNIDARYGLGGYQSRVLAPPIMAASLMEIAACLPGNPIIAESYNLLKHFIDRWFDVDHDRDGDMLPEWDHAIQTGWEDNPLFNRWQPNGKGYPPGTIEAPDLAAYLFHECKAMSNLAEQLGHKDDKQQYTTLAEQVCTSAQEMWDKRRKQFCYRDRDSHETPDGGVLLSGEGSGTIHLETTFQNLTRVCLKIKHKFQSPVSLEVQIIGKDSEGKIDLHKVIASPSDWTDNGLILTCMKAYRTIDQISIWNLPDGIGWRLEYLELNQSDLTQFIPLWAGMVDDKQAELLIRKNLLPQWSEPFLGGVPMMNKPEKTSRNKETAFPVHSGLMSMVLDGMLRYGYQTETGQLVNKLMEAIINVIRQTGSFVDHLDAKTGLAKGARNSILSLPPIGLFLRSLGLEIHSPERMTISGTNPYTWDVTIKFRGTRIIRCKEVTEITFRDGQTVQITGPEKRIIERKGDGERS
jgi:hypothetical protein